MYSIEGSGGAGLVGLVNIRTVGNKSTGFPLLSIGGWGAGAVIVDAITHEVVQGRKVVPRPQK